MDSDFLNEKKKKEVSVQLSSLTPPVSTVRLCDLHFDLLQPSDQELDPHNRFEFGNFVLRPALLDEEYWTAAWLRAESEWENQTRKRCILAFNLQHLANFLLVSTPVSTDCLGYLYFMYSASLVGAETKI
ncbi:2,3-bisphosphoglycerate-dependent phosphoglycerate mutase [Spatholobus suberectus]|nr:2,3-bisphosphoglycerate-dependent phosphoglycerate mutase [Spatholobus suberectus]